MRPFRVIDDMPAILAVEEDGIPNTVSVDRATIAPAAKEMPAENNRTQGNQTDPNLEEMHAGDILLEEENDANVLLDHNIDLRVLHLAEGYIVKYVVSWYGCQLMIRWSRQPTSSSISPLTIGKECRKKKKGHRNR